MRFSYVHFPKAGGTSLTTQLEEQFSGSIHYDYDHDPIGGEGVRTAAEPPQGCIGVCGHLHASRYADWADIVFTILREPVANLISIYFFWQSFPASGSGVHQRFLTEKPTLVDFAKHYPLRRLMSDAYFGDFDTDRLSFVGFHDTRAEAFSVLSGLLGVHLDAAYHVNKTDQSHDHARADITGNARLLAEIRDELREDVAFYDKLRTKWS